MPHSETIFSGCRWRGRGLVLSFWNAVWAFRFCADHMKPPPVRVVLRSWAFAPTISLLLVGSADVDYMVGSGCNLVEIRRPQAGLAELWLRKPPDSKLEAGGKLDGDRFPCVLQR